MFFVGICVYSKHNYCRYKLINTLPVYCTCCYYIVVDDVPKLFVLPEDEEEGPGAQQSKSKVDNYNYKIMCNVN